MKKRILAILLTLVLIFSLLPSVVIAEGEEHIHCLCGSNKTEDTVCHECGSKAVIWTAWEAKDALPTTEGYYYLKENVTTEKAEYHGVNTSICLNGCDIISENGYRLCNVLQTGVLSITDCADIDGKIRGSTKDSGGSALRVWAGGVLNFYGGHITGNTLSSDGTVFVDKSDDAAVPGGEFNMYGGHISGNSARRGAGIYMALNGINIPTIRILGGTITGNTAIGNGGTGGGAGVYAFGPVTVGGDAQIYGNTGMAGKNADIYLRNDGSFTGTLVISSEVPLEQGAQINYGLWTAETDMADLKRISGSPEKWKNVWVNYDGQKVGYADGKFFVDDGPADIDDGNYGEGGDIETGEHVHCLCGMETAQGNTCSKCGSLAVNWTAWEAKDALPTTEGYYYLKVDVTTETTDYRNGNTAICLHGYDIISKKGNKHFNVYKSGILSITDCADTDGKICSSNKDSAGAVTLIWAGGIFNLYGGHITDNLASGDGTIYVDKSDDASVPGGVFNMYGGEISGNTARRGAGVFMASNGTMYPTVRILGGTITANTGTGAGATGGGAGIVAFRPVEVGGNAKIYGNTATTAPHDILVRNDSGFTGSIVLSATNPLTDGAQINYNLKVAETDLNDLQFISGTPENWDSSWVSYDGQKVGYQDGKFFVDTGIIPSTHIHCLCGDETTEGATCIACGTMAVQWQGITTMPKVSAPGYYYLENDVAVAPFFATSGEFAFCLCGHTMTSAAGKRMFDASNGAVLSITDCAEDAGIITGATGATATGMLMCVNAGSTINLYNGKITGNSGEGSGLIFADAGTKEICGGTINIYGGEISGNTVLRGAVYSQIATNGKLPATVRILGGTITGNTGTGTGNYGAGAGVYALSPIEIGGDAKIYGNVCAVAPADLFLRDESGGRIMLSDEIPLTDGAKISYGSKNPDNTEDLQLIVGEPEIWDDNWVTYDGKAVKYKDGKFYTAAEIVISSHDHDGHSWISMTEETGLLPTKSGYYVLDGDVQLSNQLLLLNGVEVTICLNGHTLTAAENARHFELRAGSSLTICDCTAKTENGTYTAGKITGGTGAAGGAIYAYAGSKVFLYDGILCDNHATGNGGVIHLNAATVTHAATIFHMYGGMICGNSGTYGGAIRLQAPADGLAGPAFRMEGGWICDNESPDYGGALHAASGATIELLGGVIENNKAGLGGGGISVNGTSTVHLSGTVIRSNTAVTWGGGMHIKTGATLNMTGGEISGNSSKVGAGILLENTGTVMNLSGGAITGNKAGAAGGGGIFASTNTTVNMTGGSISANTTDSSGGGITLNCAYGNLTGGMIEKNTATGLGAGIAILGSQTTLGKITISGNVSEQSAGGVYVARSGEVTSYVTLDGAKILNNACKSSGGGIFVFMNGNVVTMKSGKIAGNQAENGGGVLVQRECTFTLEDGEISGNTASASGAGCFASIDSTFIMNGGTICNNYANKNAGGIYVLRAKASFNGGTISYNTGKVSGGGVYVNGSRCSLNGTWITYNQTLEGSGGGVVINSTTMKVDDVPTRFASYVSINAGLISKNKTPKAAAGLLVQAKDTVVDMYGGMISENVAIKFAGGVYVGDNAVFNMHGGSVCYNVSEKDAAGGIRHDGGGGNYTGGEVYGNTAALSGGGIMVGGTDNKVTLKNVKVYDNKAKIGAGLVHQGKGAVLKIENCEVYNNTASLDAAGIYVASYCEFYADNSHFHHNVAQGNGGGIWSWATSYVYLNNCLIEDNETKGQGGGVWTRGDGFNIIGCTLRNNTATGNGGGVCTGAMGSATTTWTPGLRIEDTLIENNTSGGIGGGLYLSSGSQGNLRDVTFTENTAAAEGGAFWAKDELTMYAVNATKNTSGGAGYAVYLDDSEYDGHSYVAGLMQMSGDMKIHDNTNGNMYLGEKTVVVVGEEGLGYNTRIELKLHSGLLTNMVWGTYHYEGGNLIYTITYGDRSMTNPEYAESVEDVTQEPAEGSEPAETPTEGGKNEPTKGSAGLYIGIGAVVAVIAAAAIIVVVAASKKKKVTK